MDSVATDLVESSFSGTDAAGAVAIPDYLSRHYWWAYIHPLAVAFFDHLWIVNLILLGNYRRLRDAALREFEGLDDAKVLQVACVYGDLSPNVANLVVGRRGTLDLVDVLPIQLDNVRRKLDPAHRVRLFHMDSVDLDLPSARYDRVMLFFLLHEQPMEVRRRTLEEAFRVVKPGGEVLIVDFAKPYWWNPFRYLWRVFLAVFEPFALDLWWNEIRELLPTSCRAYSITECRYFGGLFRKTIVSAG